jgi:prolyl-tRNA synthetase
VANEELAQSAVPESEVKRKYAGEEARLRVWRGISRDRLTLINVWYSSDNPSSSDINLHAVKAVIPELDPSVDEPLAFWAKASTLDSEDPIFPRKLINLIDYRAISASDGSLVPLLPASMQEAFARLEQETISEDHSTKKPLNLLRIKDGDKCPRCSNGSLRVQKAIELGHTFHLGTRYSEPLMATVALPAEALTGGDEMSAGKSSASTTPTTSSSEVAMQMGCHGIGISRMIGAVADTLSDVKGLNWPRAMAPYEVVVIPGKDLDSAALEVYDSLAASPTVPENSRIDLILDDRAVRFPWKLNDADLVGYPIIVVVGRRWSTEKKCEVQCRQLNLREEVPFTELSNFVTSLLVQL